MTNIVELNKLSLKRPDGETYTLFYRTESIRLIETPAWNPDTEDIPLSFSDGYQIAKKWLQQVGVRILHPFSFNIHSRDSIHWYYIFTFKTEDCYPMPQFATAIILMDGSVIEPIRSDIDAVVSAHTI